MSELRLVQPVATVMSLTMKQHYRPDIDGLRAIAVAIVVAFHADLGCPGGYIGVDVFFVISGFLITSLLLKDLERGEFSLLGFWERRARRIIPALVTVTLVTLIAGWFILFPSDYESLGDSALAQSIFSANFFFWRTTGYFKGTADEKPLLHTWSLSVEEQFYLLAPLVLFLCYKSKGLRARQKLLLLAGLAGGASFALSVSGVQKHPDLTFYLLPTRAWELLVGVTLAMFPASWLLKRRGSNELLSFGGLAAIVLPAICYGRQTEFPGLAALAPCVGTALIIYTNSHERTKGSPGTILGKALSIQPLVFLGLISYSLYLWHWPILAYCRYWFPEALSTTYRLVAVGVAGVLAVLSWRYVETPFRKRSICSSRRGVLSFAIAALVVVFILGLGARFCSDLDFRIPPQAQVYASGKKDMCFINELSVRDVSIGRLVPLGRTNSSGGPTFLVWGDSHAMAILPAFAELANQFGVEGVAVTHSATAPVYAGYPHNFGMGLRGREAQAFGRAVLRFIELHNVREVVLAAHWSGYGVDETATGDVAGLATQKYGLLINQIGETVKLVEQAGARVWILEEVPGQSVDVPRTLARCYMSGANPEQFASKAGDDMRRADFKACAEEALSNTSVNFVDLAPLLLALDGQRYRMTDGQGALYRDRHHLSVRGAMFVRQGLKVIFENLRPMNEEVQAAGEARRALFMSAEQTGSNSR